MAHPIYGADGASKAAAPSIFESGQEFFGNFLGQALSIGSQGILNDMRSDAGLAKPQAQNQQEALVGPGGENRSAAPANDSSVKQWLIIGGGVVLFVLVVMVLLGSRK